MRRMRSALEIITAIRRHRIDGRPAHHNHRSDERRQAVRLFEEVTVIEKRKRNKRKHSLLTSLRKETEQRNHQKEMLPRDLVRRHKSVPRHEYRKQEDVEDFGRGRPRLQQVNRHAAQERRRRKSKLIALEPLAKRKEERDQAQDVERIVHCQGRIAVRLHEVEHERIDEPERLALEVVHLSLAIQNAIRPDSFVTDTACMLEVHLEPHRLPARLVTQDAVRIANVREDECREYDEQKRKPAKTFSARQESSNMFRDKRDIDNDSRHKQQKREENRIITPFDIPMASIRNRKIIKNDKGGNEHNGCHHQHNILRLIPVKRILPFNKSLTQRLALYLDPS